MDKETNDEEGEFSFLTSPDDAKAHVLQICSLTYVLA